MATSYWDNYAALVHSEEYQKYLKSGRVTVPGYSDPKLMYNNAATQLATIKAQDKQISQYYELTTGKKADQTVIDKYSEYANDPSLLAAAINKEATLAPATGGFKDQINSTIQEKMGRPATEAELGYFGKQMEQGNLDAYGLQDFIQGTTEYQTKASDTARQKLATELGGVDTEYLNKVQKGLEAKYAAAGRSGASAFGSALIGAGKDIATQRTGYLAGLDFQNFQSGQDNLKAAYQNRLSQMYASQQGVPTAQATNAQRYYSQQDYDRSAAAQERLARLSQPRQGTFLEGLIPGLIQGGATIIGGTMGGPVGASVGNAAGGYLSNKLSINPNGRYY